MTLSDLLRIYGDVTLTQYGAFNGDGRRTEVRFVYDHPAVCPACEGRRYVMGIDPLVNVPCPVCHGSGLALELGGEA